MTTLATDVLMIGLGPAGGSAAVQAARLGLTVIAVDRKKEIGRPVQCAEFMPLPLGRWAQPDGVLAQRARPGRKFARKAGSSRSGLRAGKRWLPCRLVE